MYGKGREGKGRERREKRIKKEERGGVRRVHSPGPRELKPWKTGDAAQHIKEEREIPWLRLPSLLSTNVSSGLLLAEPSRKPVDLEAWEMHLEEPALPHSAPDRHPGKG